MMIVMMALTLLYVDLVFLEQITAVLEAGPDHVCSVK